MKFSSTITQSHCHLTPPLISTINAIVSFQYQGSKKVPSGCPGQVDFPFRQVTFHSHLPNGQGPRKVIYQLNHKKSNLRLAQGKQNLRATCPKGKLEFKFFSRPAISHSRPKFSIHSTISNVTQPPPLSLPVIT